MQNVDFREFQEIEARNEGPQAKSHIQRICTEVGMMVACRLGGHWQHGLWVVGVGSEMAQSERWMVFPGSFCPLGASNIYAPKRCAVCRSALGRPGSSSSGQQSGRRPALLLRSSSASVATARHRGPGVSANLLLIPAAMGDLEESFLKSNVPGRYSAWADDDEGDSKDDTGIDSAEGPPALNRLEVPTSRNTGAKGVLADHRAAKEEETYRRETEKRETDAILNRAVRGVAMGPGEVSISQAAMEERRRAERIRDREAERGDSSDTDGDGDGDSSDDDDDDDEFMRSYRQKRLLELQTASASASTAANTSRPDYSEVEDVTPIQYAEAVDETDPGTLLVVHLYEPHIPACADVHNHLDTLARSHACGTSSGSCRSIRFLRLRATEAKSDMDLVGLPSLLVYRGGRLVHNWTPVTQHLPPRFTAEDLQTLLLDSCGWTTGAAAATAITSAGIPRGDSYDSDDAELDEYCADFAG